MDEMKIASKFTRGLISNALGMVLRSKLGCKADIHLNEFNARVANGKAHVHLSIDANMTQEELAKLMKIAGLA